MHKDDILYITSMKKYINSYENKIKQYIQDLNEYILLEKLRTICTFYMIKKTFLTLNKRVKYNIT